MRSAFEVLAHPDVTLEALARVWPELGGIDGRFTDRLDADAKYAVYLDRQRADIEAFARDEGLPIPVDLDYSRISGLSAELRTRLETIRPRTLGQAGRVEGVTPAAITVLAAHSRRARTVDAG
jgi:tRNA uridine 5-carboxymethylaminomethyl modification enzyme